MRQLLKSLCLAATLLALAGPCLAAEPLQDAAGRHPAETLARTPLPPELQALVGKRIPAQKELVRWRRTARGTSLREVLRPGDIPGFRRVALGSVDVGFVGQTPVLVVVRLTPALERKITDIEVIPQEHFNRHLENGVIREGPGQYGLEDICSRGYGYSDDRYESIVALSAPEEGLEHCEHSSRQVKMAWGVVRGTGRLELIDPARVECLLPGDDQCK